MHCYICNYAQSTPVWRHVAISENLTMRMEDRPPEILCLKEELLQHITHRAMAKGCADIGMGRFSQLSRLRTCLGPASDQPESDCPMVP